MAAPVQRDQELELTIESLAYGGNGVARLDGFVVFVRRGLPGDTVRARVTKVQRRHAEALATEVVTRGPKRVDAPCAHYPACGGCRFQDLAYDAQLEAKAAWVSDSLRRIAGLADPPLEPIVPAASQFGYRNKMEYSFTQYEDAPTLGLHKAGRWDEVLEIERCWLTSDLGNAIRNRMREWAREERLEAYDQAAEKPTGLPSPPRRPRGPQHRAGAGAAGHPQARAVRPRAADRGADGVRAGALDPLVGQRHAGRGDEPADGAPLGRGRDRGGDRRAAVPRAAERVPPDEHRDGRAAVRAGTRVRGARRRRDGVRPLLRDRHDRALVRPARR